MIDLPVECPTELRDACCPIQRAEVLLVQAQLYTGSEVTFGDGFLAKYRLVYEEDPVAEAATAEAGAE